MLHFPSWLHREQWAGNQAGICDLMRCLFLGTCREERLAGLLRAQEPLLYSCNYLLLNLAEDPVVEQKMLKKVCRWAMRLCVPHADAHEGVCVCERERGEGVTVMVWAGSVLGYPAVCTACTSMA